MKDPYQTLGVGRTASPEDIKRSYRRLAKRLHPDLNPGDKRIEQQFKEVTAAYDLLSDPEKRARFDSGEIDAGGAERGFRYTRREAGGGRARPFFAEDNASVDDIIAEILRGKRGPGAQRARPARRGEDAKFTLAVPFVEAALGAKKRVALGAEKTVEITIPAGIENGQTLRLKGQGDAGQNGGEAGDALIEITVEPHPVFTRKQRDILSELSVSLPEAVLGATVTAPTLHGPVALKVPPGANTGTMLRLRGKGLPARGQAAAGDHYVSLRVVLPDSPDPELVRFIESWAARHPYRVRDE
ncbi:MAG TPA: J domain-containing protein [Stellaceae bacterium]|nr:J domain-containing protein [Stellaceae bacterium]